MEIPIIFFDLLSAITLTKPFFSFIVLALALAETGNLDTITSSGLASFSFIPTVAISGLEK